MAYSAVSIIVSSTIAVAGLVAQPDPSAAQLMAVHLVTEPGAASGNVTVVYKDPNGLWPGGRRWIGIEKQDAGLTGSDSVPKIIVIDPRQGFDV